MIMLEKDILKLKKEIQDPGYTDREGRTILDRRADANMADHDRHDSEITIVNGMIDSISDLRRPEISRLTSFVEQSGLSKNEIAKKMASALRAQSDKLNPLQRAEILRFVLDEDTEAFNEREVRLMLSQLTKARPWIYAEILSRKNPREAVKLIERIILDRRYVYSSFVHLFLRWMQIPDREFIEWMGRIFLNVLEDPNGLKMVARKLEALGIVISETIEADVDFEIPPSPKFLEITESESFKDFIEAFETNAAFA